MLQAYAVSDRNRESVIFGGGPDLRLDEALALLKSVNARSVCA